MTTSDIFKLNYPSLTVVAQELLVVLAFCLQSASVTSCPVHYALYKSH